MTRLQQRIKQLEEVYEFDPSGCAPQSPPWMEYWDRQVARHVAGEPNVHLTLAGLRSAIRRAPTEGWKCLGSDAEHRGGGIDEKPKMQS
jgi:hypothetical protein